MYVIHQGGREHVFWIIFFFKKTEKMCFNFYNITIMTIECHNRNINNRNNN